MLETLFLSLNYEKSECINLKNCALGGSIILSTGGSIFVSAEEQIHELTMELIFELGKVLS